jgi:type IV pilus assembly protein PilV
MTNRLPSRSRGTTLIEAMAALAVFTVGILGVMQMNVLASRQNNLARSESTAGKIARDLAYAFERLPYNHPAFNNVTAPAMAPTSAAFTDFTNTNGRVLLQDLSTLAGANDARPLVSAAEATMRVEGGSSNGVTYEVAWRTTELRAPDSAANDTRVIVIMVRFRSIGNTFRQVNVWTVKYNPEVIIGAGATIQEI